MKIIIIDTYYSLFIDKYWKKNKNLQSSTYASQLQGLLSACFGTSDNYSFHLKKLGHEAWDIIANDKVSQQKWAKEHKVKYLDLPLYDRITSLPYAYRLLGRSPWVQQIVLAQVKYYHPDIVYVQDLSILTPSTMRKIKSLGIMLVGQIACPLPVRAQLTPFDLILTSFPHYVDKFRKMGINSEYYKIGFDERLPKLIGKQKRKYEVSFVGSFSPHHAEGTKILEQLSQKVPIHVWGQGLSKSSPLYKNYHGEAWGKEMYKVLGSSKIVINRHIGVAGKYANNMRLFEATGMGAMLITDYKENLNQFFKVDSEIVAYSSPTDLLKKVKYYLNHEQERAKIAKKGQIRTMQEHTYQHRIKELLTIINRKI